MPVLFCRFCLSESNGVMWRRREGRGRVHEQRPHKQTQCLPLHVRGRSGEQPLHDGRGTPQHEIFRLQVFVLQVDGVRDGHEWDGSVLVIGRGRPGPLWPRWHGDAGPTDLRPRTLHLLAAKKLKKKQKMEFFLFQTNWKAIMIMIFFFFTCV